MYVNHYLTTTDVHVGGAALRVFRLAEKMRSTSMIEYRHRLNQPPFALQWKRLLEEPRGHLNMMLCIVTPPVSNGAEAGLLFKNANGDLPLPIHGLIGVTTVLAETEGLTGRTCLFDTIDGPRRVRLDFNPKNQKAVQVQTEQTLTVDRARTGMRQSMRVQEPSTGRSLVLQPVDPLKLPLTIEHLDRIQAEAERIFQALRKQDAAERLLLYEIRGGNPDRFLTIDRDGLIDRSPLNGAGAFTVYLMCSGRLADRKQVCLLYTSDAADE